MSRAILLSAATLLAFSLPASADTKTYDVGSFSELDVSAGVKVYFEAGESQSIIAETKKGDFDRLIIKTKGDTLVISRKSRRWSWWGRNRNKDKFTVRITAPAIEAVEASSGSYVDASGLKGEVVRLSSSSGANLSARSVKATDVRVNSSSGSKLEASGSCYSIRASSSSGSSIKASDLVCEAVDARSSSGSSLRAHATKSVEGHASSGSSIRVVGGAVEQSTSQSSGGSVRISS